MWEKHIDKCSGEQVYHSPRAAAFGVCIGNRLNDYLLIINGREYNWPERSPPIGLGLNEVEAHIRECIRIDEGFYGTN